MCKEAVVSKPASADEIAEDPDAGYQWVKGFKWGILSMMSAPFLLIGFGGWFIVRNMKRERTQGNEYENNASTPR